MNAMAPTRPAELQPCRVRLTTGPAAAAGARSHVRVAVCACDVLADPEVAVLLPGELVSNALRHEARGTAAAAVTSSCDQMRVDVHDPVQARAPGLSRP
jgi:hypothetical protein